MTKYSPAFPVGTPEARFLAAAGDGTSAAGRAMCHSSPARSGVRRHSRITTPSAGPRLDGVVPLWMPGVAFDVQGGHFGIGDLDALGIGFLVQFTLHRQPCFGR